MSQVAIAILAAGRGSRFGSESSKLLATFQGKPLISYAVSAALQSSVRPILVVVGYDAEAFLPYIPSEIQVIYNPNWQQGIAWSLKSAILALDPDPNIGAVCIGLGDQPWIGSGAYQRVSAAFSKGIPFAVGTYQRERRNPVLLARSLWAAALELQADEGARRLMKHYPVEEIPCDGTGDPVDIDTEDQLIRLDPAYFR